VVAEEERAGRDMVREDQGLGLGWAAVAWAEAGDPVARGAGEVREQAPEPEDLEAAELV